MIERILSEDWQSEWRELTTCSSHDNPSAIYLKHLSQTQSIDFSPPCVRPNPPASRSDVRPCERKVERLTPGIRVVEDVPCEPGVAACSSVSDSVRG